MDQIIFSGQLNKAYKVKDVVRIVNPKQYSLYLLHGARIVDVYGSYDDETGEPITVFVFNRKDTYHLYDLWCKYQLV